MSASVLVVGANGFLGKAIADRLAASGTPTHRAARDAGGDVRPLDLADRSAVAALLDELRPAAVVNAAWVPGDPWQNLAALEGLLDAVEARAGTRLVHLGSAAEYGAQPGPVAETAREQPAGPYGVCKLAQTHLCLARRRRGLPATVARVFNVIGRGLPAHHAPSQFARQLREIRGGTRTALAIGPLETVRDFLEVDQIAAAVAALASAQDRPPLVNVCSGRGTRMAEVLAELCRQLDVSPPRPPAVAPVPGDVPVSVGDPTLLREVTGLRLELDLACAVRGLLET